MSDGRQRGANLEQEVADGGGRLLHRCVRDRGRVVSASPGSAGRRGVDDDRWRDGVLRRRLVGDAPEQQEQAGDGDGEDGALPEPAHPLLAQLRP
jgi:hypothetical protein